MSFLVFVFSSSSCRLPWDILHQLMVVFPMTFYDSHSTIGMRGGLVVNASDSGSRGRGFEPHSGQTVLCP